jgi:hypothetical protein
LEVVLEEVRLGLHLVQMEVQVAVVVVIAQFNKVVLVHQVKVVVVVKEDFLTRLEFMVLEVVEEVRVKMVVMVKKV